MTAIKNIQPLSPEAVFDLLKVEFSEYVNNALGSNLSVEFAHVADIVNISFPEVIEGTVFTLTVSDDSIEVSKNETEGDYNTDLLEEQLNEFLAVKAG
ncbi:hypothetical protein SAMN06265348_11427 [Pedobacter westerhofensis]|uniref:Uncharacterized protein n=1 Tax=Pedobacter westerhofensis TaxID=425512 RepID=A0A521FM75_9SPHI|nr:hypothetical protein [Pedobacter westerhofensis]SMO97293.1 hypothetical protein SAMN06265348_11427 [Pedobacter westerhofensis]